MFGTWGKLCGFPEVLGDRRSYLADTAEHKGLALVIPVGSHSQVHLFGVGIPLEGLGHPQDGIRGTHLHSTPP